MHPVHAPQPRRDVVTWVLAAGLGSAVGLGGWWTGRAVSADAAEGSDGLPAPSSSPEAPSSPTGSSAPEASPSAAPSASESPEETPSGTSSASQETMPDLRGKGIDEALAALPEGIELQTRAVAVPGLGAATVITQRPAPGQPIGPSVQLTLRGAPVLHPLAEYAEGIGDPKPMTIGNQQLEAVEVPAKVLLEGIEIALPPGAANLVWSAWLPNPESDPNVTVLIIDGEGRIRRRAVIGSRSPLRLRLPVQDAGSLTIVAADDFVGPLAFADAGVEVVE